MELARQHCTYDLAQSSGTPNPFTSRGRKPRMAVVLLLVLGLALVCLTPLWGADGGLDLSFDPGTGVRQIPMVRGQVGYADGSGKSLVYGYFTAVDGTIRNSIARINADGTLDTSFLNAGVNGEIRYAFLYTNASSSNYNKILICGTFFVTVSGKTYYNLARLSSDGTVDTAFANTFNAPGAVNGVGVQSDGKIVLGAIPSRSPGMPIPSTCCAC